MSDNQHQRKAERSNAYWRDHGRKLITCTACNGSGVYDHIGSPPCGWCEGNGKDREPLASPPPAPPLNGRDKLKHERDISKHKQHILRGAHHG
jgi:hypothetical protein